MATKIVMHRAHNFLLKIKKKGANKYMGIEKEAILSCMYYENLEVHKQR